MSYTLGLLFEYHRYHHDAIVRVYADDRLVDELSLTSDINIKTSNLAGMLNSFIGPSNKMRVIFTPEKLFLFEIDERHLHDCIRIEVQNDNNNHTNGFMTDFSYVKFHNILLLPSCLLEYKNWQRLLERFGDWVQTNSQIPHRPSGSEIILKPDTRQNTDKLRGNILGGSFTMEIPLSRKHGITHLGRLAPGRLGLTDDHLVLWAFGQLNMSI